MIKPNETEVLMDGLLMTQDAARLLGKSPETVRVYERSGKLPALKTVTGRRLFKESDVMKLKLAQEAERRDGVPIPPAV